MTDAAKPPAPPRKRKPRTEPPYAESDVGKGRRHRATVVTFPRSETDRLRLSVQNYGGKDYLDARREFSRDGGETWTPTSKGATFRLAEIPVLIAALLQLEMRLREYEQHGTVGGVPVDPSSTPPREAAPQAEGDALGVVEPAR